MKIAVNIFENILVDIVAYSKIVKYMFVNIVAGLIKKHGEKNCGLNVICSHLNHWFTYASLINF